MESLVDEIFYDITCYFDTRDLAQLVVTSKTFANRLEPTLYGSPDARNRTLHWACITGNVAMARRAAVWGAHIGVVSGPSSSSVDSPQSSPMLTLYLAAKHNRPRLFQLLIELGARMDEPAVENIGVQVKKIMYWLCRKRELHDCLRMVLESRLDGQVRELHCPTIAWPLIPAIAGRVPSSTIEQLCERGADPNQRLHRHNGEQTPLSTAILNGSVEVVDLLINKGALISGNIPSSPPKSPTSIPIFAAAKAMALSGTHRGVFDACLDYGADLNDRAAQRCNLKRYGDDQDLMYLNSRKALYYLTTPFLTYLENVPSWPLTRMEAQLKNIDFFTNRSARDLLHDEKLFISNQAPYFEIQPPPSCVELLLCKWGVKRLAEQGFTDVLVYLAKRGGASLNHKNMFIQHQWYGDGTHSHNIVTAWRRLVSAAVEHTLASTPGGTAALDLLLADLIAEKARAEFTRTEAPHLDNLCLATIEVLLHFGANINAPVLCRDKTPLYDVCEYFSIASTNPDRWASRALTIPSIVQRRLHLVKFLRGKGADPWYRVGDTNPVGVLVEGLDRASEWGRPFVLDVKKILEDGS